MQTDPSEHRFRSRGGALILAATILLGSILPRIAFGANNEESQARITRHVAAGRPIVVHVIVALCDNENQGIIPVPAHLGNGQDPGSNLYWGALYGVRTFFTGKGGWTRLSAERPSDRRILDRAVFFDFIQRGDSAAPVYVVADAWDGAEIRAAIERFLEIAAGGAAEEISIRSKSEEVTIAAGGSAHMVVYVGHNGLMEFSLHGPEEQAEHAAANSSIVLACASKPYFLDLLRAAGSHSLMLTTGLMAPEAYTLNAAIRSWAGGNSATSVCEAAAREYDRYQHCGLRAARNLFWCQ